MSLGFFEVFIFGMEVMVLYSSIEIGNGIFLGLRGFRNMCSNDYWKVFFM